jgi:hypothetical protein
MLTNGKDTMHKLSKAQYGELIREIQKAIKKHAMKGGGMYDFAAAETYVEQLPDLPFYVHVDGMEGGGIKDSLKAAAKRVYKAVMGNDNVKAALAQGKDKLAGKALDVGKKAIDKLGEEAEKRGASSMVTAMVTDRAKDALAKSEGSLKSQINKAAGKLEKHVGLDGDGLTLAGRGMHVAGSGLHQTGHGMKVSGSGHYHGGASGFITRSSATPGIPAGSMQVGFTNHISSRMPAGGY